MSAHLGSHTVRSHGMKVARTHLHDWLILILLLAIVVILNAIHPFYRFVGKDMMTDLKYPLKSNTVPIWAVPAYAVLLPIVVFLLVYFRRNDVYDLHHAILGLLFSVLITAVITDAIKDAVGRPRPDFFWRCFPDGKEGPLLVLPFCHFIYLARYKSLTVEDMLQNCVLCYFRFCLHLWFAISRVDDCWHHWQDVFPGGLIGLVVAALCYLQFFPPPYHVQGWATYAYFRVLEESQRTSQSENAVNANVNNTLSAEVQVESQHNERNHHALWAFLYPGILVQLRKI